MMSNASKHAPRVCLTGGIATGKSRVGQWFFEQGWEVICADEIVHELYRSGQAVAASVGREFGPGVLAGDGSVNRSRLGEIVFSDPAKLRRLNALVHSVVHEAWSLRAECVTAEGRPAMVVIPLAYEVGIQGEFDHVWVVACSARSQEKRLAARGLDCGAVAKRVAAQLPLQSKVDCADGVIWNDGPWELTEAQCACLDRASGRNLALS